MGDSDWWKNPAKQLGAAGLASGAVIALWRFFEPGCDAPPRIFVGEGQLSKKVLPLCTSLLRPFKPTPWARGQHAQTILGFLRSATISCKYTRQLVLTSDGGTLGLDWFNHCDSPRYGPSTAPIFLVLHGINGGSQEGYCKWVCATAAKKGWRAVVLNYRGCNGLPLTSPRGYNAAVTHDVHCAIASIKARFPDAPLFAAGYSLGGVILTKYLSDSEEWLHDDVPGSGLVAAAVVSSPVCLFNSSANLSKPWTFNYVYNMAVAYKLREYMAEHRKEIISQTTANVEAALKSWTVQEFDDEGDVPKTFGYQSRQEYYEQASSLKHIPSIRTPTLFLIAQDDPFLGVLPDVECSSNPYTLLAATQKGGHVAFLQGWWPLRMAYMDAAVIEFMEVTWKHFQPEQRAGHVLASVSQLGAGGTYPSPTMQDHSSIGLQAAPAAATIRSRL